MLYTGEMQAFPYLFRPMEPVSRLLELYMKSPFSVFLYEQFLKDENAKVLLPHFSCHSLRHTFTTRMCEAGVNVKVIQDTLGHKDISTTLNIYTDVTKELRRSEFEGLDSYFKNEYNKANEVL